MKDSCAKVFCRRCGERSGPVQNGRHDIVQEGAFGFDRARAMIGAAHMAHHVGRNRVAIVAERGRLGRGRARPEFLGLKSRQKSGDDISRIRVDRAIPQHRRPRFVIPRDDISLRVEAGALVHHECESVILPRHFVFSGELDAHRFANGLRKQRGVIRDRIGAVDSVAARATAKNHAHIFGLQTEQHGQRASLVPNALRRRPHRGLVALHIGDGARTADRSVHLIRMVVGRLHHGRGFGKFLVHVLGIHEQRVARRLLIPQMVVKRFLLRQFRSR